MKKIIILILIAYRMQAHGQELLPTQQTQPINYESRKFSEELNRLIQYVNLITNDTAQVKIFPDTVNQFYIIPKRSSIYIAADSLVSKESPKRLTVLYGYIVSHCIAHKFTNSVCDSNLFVEFNADCLSGYFMKNAGLVDSEQELLNTITESLLERYFSQSSGLKRFERSFALFKGMENTRIGIGRYKGIVDSMYNLYKSNSFNEEYINYECIMNNGSHYFIGFPNQVFKKQNGSYHSIGYATSLDTNYWYYWLKLEIDKTYYYMDNNNHVCDNYGKIVGKIVKIATKQLANN